MTLVMAVIKSNNKNQKNCLEFANFLRMSNNNFNHGKSIDKKFYTLSIDCWAAGYQSCVFLCLLRDNIYWCFEGTFEENYCLYLLHKKTQRIYFKIIW